ncbi:MAG: hypothetical protein JF597_31425, partial [Streptomyces sp.]|nr:hypothetical protein [Streptomyces sp.]
EIGPLEDANGVRRKVTLTQRLRASMAKGMFGPDTHIPKPTKEEYRELSHGEH